MLQLLLGRAGSGKTHTVYEKLASAPRGSVLLVPEQYSFESERALLERGIDTAEVLSFSRLCHQMLCLYGGIAGKRPGEGEKLLLMARAVRLSADELEIYRRQVKSADFYRHMLSIISELRYCGVTPADLERTALLLQNPLKQKIGEIARIAQTYLTLLGEAYTDPDDDMDRLCGLLQEHAYFKGKQVYIDGFKDFTAPQLEVIRHILQQADEVTLALCADGLDITRETERFAGTKAVAVRLIRMAGELGIAAAAPTLLTQNRRAAVPALAAAEAILAEKAVPPTDGNEAITVCRCTSRYEEADMVAAIIARGVREQGLRYRDITVIARDPAVYDGLLDAALDRCGIPYFYDRSRPVTDQPLMVCVSKILDCMADGFSTDRLFSLCKTGITGLSPLETARLENYAFIWNLTGRSFTEPFTLNPAGMAQKPADETALAELEQLRRRLVEPLQNFRQQCPATGTARRFATAIYDYLSAVKAEDRLTETARTLTEQGHSFEAEDLYRSWGVLMTALDQTVAAFGDTPLEKEDFRQLFQLLLTRSELNKIPQGIDQVTIGAADRTRPGSEKMVVLLGANQGVFPAVPASGGLLSDRERALLKENDIPLSDHGIEDAVKEEFIFYSAAAAATHRLVFTFIDRDEQQKLHPCRPLAALITGLSLTVYTPETYRQTVDPLMGAEAVIPAFDRLAGTIHQPDAVTGGLWEYFAAHQPERLALLQRLIRLPAPDMTADRARRLYGTAMTVSPTQVETYHKCGFFHFCRYGLRVEKPRPVALDAMTTGTVIHHVLEHMLKRHGSNGLQALTPADLQREIHLLMQEYRQSVFGGDQEKSAYFDFQMYRLETLLQSLLTRMAEELSQSLFETVACELPIRKEPGAVPPVVLPLKDGGSLAVTGVVDRLDIYRKGNDSYLRVVDYKTTGKEFRLDELYFGLGMQMLIYLFAIEKNGTAFGDHRIPAGVFYMRASENTVTADPGRDREEWLEERDKALKMNGLICDDPEVLQGMDPNRRNRLLPLKYNKDGGLSAYSSVADPGFFVNISREIDSLLTQMGNTLLSGQVTCDPLDPVGNHDACDYCDFKAACPQWVKRPHRKIPALSNDEKKAIKKGGEHHGI